LFPFVCKPCTPASLCTWLFGVFELCLWVVYFFWGTCRDSGARYTTHRPHSFPGTSMAASPDMTAFQDRETQTDSLFAMETSDFWACEGDVQRMGQKVDEILKGLSEPGARLTKFKGLFGDFVTGLLHRLHASKVHSLCRQKTTGRVWSGPVRTCCRPSGTPMPR